MRSNSRSCSSASRSEIVLPGLKNQEVFLVMDVDSDKLNDFDEADREGLSSVIGIIQRLL